MQEVDIFIFPFLNATSLTAESFFFLILEALHEKLRLGATKHAVVDGFGLI